MFSWPRQSQSPTITKPNTVNRKTQNLTRKYNQSFCYYSNQTTPDAMMTIDTTITADAPRFDAVLFSPIVSTRKQPKRKSVSFFPKACVHQVLNRSDYTHKESQATWYSMGQLRAIKRHNRMLAIHLSTKAAEDSSMRGLEGRTPEGLVNRKEVKATARNAVMLEQDRQRKWGINNAQTLAQIYSYFSEHSRLQAHMVGLCDQKEATEYHNHYRILSSAPAFENESHKNSRMSYTRSDSMRSVTSLISVSSSTRRLLSDAIFMV